MIGIDRPDGQWPIGPVSLVDEFRVILFLADCSDYDHPYHESKTLIGRYLINLFRGQWGHFRINMDM